MALAPINLTELQGADPIVDKEGRPSRVFLRFINGSIRSLKNGINGIQSALDAAGIATAAAATATAAAAAATSATAAASAEQALVNSYMDPTSVISATTADITVASHDRIYTTNPLTVTPVTGATVPHAFAAATTVYVYYVDAARAGGAVTYDLSITAPTQTGDVHVIGAVTIPAAGTQAGGNGPRRPGEVEP